MCLYSKQILPRRATKDIICYKVLCCTGSCFRTPYYDMRMDINKEYEAKGPKIAKAFIKNNYQKYFAIVEKGYIHCFTQENAARDMWFYDVRKRVIMKCIIPKGTLYYKSKNGLEICARKIKTLERIA